MPANTHGGVLRGLGASVAERRKALLLAESVGVLVLMYLHTPVSTVKK